MAFMIEMNPWKGWMCLITDTSTWTMVVVVISVKILRFKFLSYIAEIKSEENWPQKIYFIAFFLLKLKSTITPKLEKRMKAIVGAKPSFRAIQLIPTTGIKA